MIPFKKIKWYDFIKKRKKKKWYDIPLDYNAVSDLVKWDFCSVGGFNFGS